MSPLYGAACICSDGCQWPQVTAFSGEVRDACSSVTSDVRDMLVCLAPRSMRRELERKDNPEDEATLEEVRSKSSLGGGSLVARDKLQAMNDAPCMRMARLKGKSCPDTLLTGTPKEEATLMELLVHFVSCFFLALSRSNVKSCRQHGRCCVEVCMFQIFGDNETLDIQPPKACPLWSPTGKPIGDTAGFSSSLQAASQKYSRYCFELRG